MFGTNWQPGISAPLSQYPTPLTCEASPAVLQTLWQNEYNTFQFTIGGFGAEGYLAYFGTDAGGQNLTPAHTPAVFTPETTLTGTYKYYLNLAHATHPSEWVTCYEIWYDSEPPDIASAYATVPGVTNGIWQNAVNNPTFTINFTDTGSGIASYYLYFGADPDEISSDQILGSPGNFTPPGPLADGTYYLRAKGIDSLGQESDWSTLFTFLLDTQPPANVTPPAVTIPPMQESDYHNEPSPVFDWEDASGASTYEVYWGSDPLGTSPTTLVGLSEFQPAVPLPDNGTYYLRVRSLDEAGNIGGDFVTLFTYLYDAEGPDGVISVTETNGLTTGICQAVTRSAIFTWNSPDPPSGAQIAAYDYYWGEDPAGTGTGSTTETTLSLSVQPGGKHYLRLSVRDYAGNNSPWNTVFQLCHGHKVAAFTPIYTGYIGISVPDPFEAVITVPENAYPDHYYLRLVHPADVSLPDYLPAPPRNHTPFRIYADTYSDLSTIGSLNEGILITVHYTEESVLALLENTLMLYRYADGEWQEIKNSTLDMENNAVTASTSSMGTFVLMGTPVPEHERLQVKFCPVQFPSVLLTGTKQTIQSIPCPWSILDARYNDAGWHVTVEATDFENTIGQKIILSNLSIQVPQATITTEVGSGIPSSLVDEHTPFVAGGMNIINMAQGASGGRFIIRPRFQLEIPAETYEGAYQSTLTITIISGPN